MRDYMFDTLGNLISFVATPSTKKPSYKEHYNKGLIHFYQNDYVPALVHLIEAVKINKECKEAWNIMAHIYENHKEYNDAKRCYKALIEIDSNDYRAVLNKGRIYYKQQNYDKALEHTKNALWLTDFKFKEAWTQKALIRLALNEPDNALHAAERAIYIDSNYVNAWGIKGIALLRLEQDTKALDCFKKVIELEPNNEYAWKKIFVIKKRMRIKNAGEDHDKNGDKEASCPPPPIWSERKIILEPNTHGK
jgi:superkiller protein 3